MSDYSLLTVKNLIRNLKWWTQLISKSDKKNAFLCRYNNEWIMAPSFHCCIDGLQWAETKAQAAKVYTIWYNEVCSTSNECVRSQHMPGVYPLIERSPHVFLECMITIKVRYRMTENFICVGLRSWKKYTDYKKANAKANVCLDYSR